jgi:hypothetical protein
MSRKRPRRGRESAKVFNEKWDDEKWDDLARYNGEKAAGLVHTEEHARRMAEKQKLYNQAVADGTIWDYPAPSSSGGNQ